MGYNHRRKPPPIEPFDLDKDLTDRINQAAWDAGLCEDCHRPRIDPGNPDECECIGGNRALIRYDKYVDWLLKKRIEEEN